MINYSIVLRTANSNAFEINQAKARIATAKANNQQPSAEDEALVATEIKKAYAQAQYNEVMNLQAFARHIATHGCVYSRADIVAILTMAVDCLREQLLAGQKIQLGDLGSFYLSLNSKGADSAKTFNPTANITSVNVNWEQSREFKNLIDEAEWNLVASRVAQAAVVKAIKAGETIVDLSKPTDDDPSDNNPSGGGQTPPPPHPSGISITSIDGKTYGQTAILTPGNTYAVYGTKLTDLVGDNFGNSEGASFKFEAINDEFGFLSLDEGNILSSAESTLTCYVFDDPIFMIKTKGA